MDEKSISYMKSVILFLMLCSVWDWLKGFLCKFSQATVDANTDLNSGATKMIKNIISTFDLALYFFWFFWIILVFLELAVKLTL